MNFMPCIYIYIYTHTYIDRYCSRESDVSLLTAKWAGCWANTMPCCPSLTSTQYLGSETRGPWSPSSKPGSPTKPAAFLVLVPSAALTLHGMSASFILPTEGCTLDSPWVSISLLLKRLDKFDSSCHKKNMKMDASWGPWHSQQHVFRFSNIICICLCICICIYILHVWAWKPKWSFLKWVWLECFCLSCAQTSVSFNRPCCCISDIFSGFTFLAASEASIFFPVKP